MRISGNNSGFDMMALMQQLQNSRNSQLNTGRTNTNGQQAQTQVTDRMAEFTSYAASRGLDTSSEFGFGARNFNINNGSNLSTGLSQEHLEWRTNWQNPEFRANLWLNGIEGREGFEEPLGVQVFTQLLRESGIELPENARFDISVDRYGGVTITGLDHEDLTRAIEEAMSYNSQMVISVLSQFMEHGRILEGHPSSSTSLGLSEEQQRLISVQSALMNIGADLRNLSIGENGRIQGLPQELYDRIYGDRSTWQSDMDPAQARWYNQHYDAIRDNAVHFLRNGTNHVSTPDISLTFDNGRITVNGISTFSPSNNGGINVTI